MVFMEAAIMKKDLRAVGVIVSVVVVFAVILLLGMPSVSLAEPKGEPIVIGYVGQVASPGTKPCMDIQKMAVDEINAAGGILGRPVKYIVQDGKGDTSLSVEAARKLIIEDKASFVSVEGRSEISLAVQENSGNLFKEYPHVLVFNGPMGSELTARIIDEAPKYDFCFRDWDPEPAHYAQTKYIMETWKKTMGVKKIAFLWEDLAWTTEWRKGIDYMKLPTWEKLAKEVGLEVVYSKGVKPRGTLYYPILQEIAQKKADMIWFISSWFTDTDAFAKQWADSAAKDIYVSFYGGVAQTRRFWSMTGGKALGTMSSFTDLDGMAVTPKTIPLMEKAAKMNIPMQIHVHIAYADIYHFKAAIEAAGGTDNIKKLIKSMEDVTTEYSLGKMKYETKKVKPFYHSRMRVDPNNPYKSYPGYYYQLLVQFQENGKIVFLNESCPENEKAMKRFINPKGFKSPAQLRKIQAGGK
jgi:ABC-type branched-subunit amino acid transport system substrate-binding protein